MHPWKKTMKARNLKRPNFVAHLPPGVKLSDIFIDLQEVAQQLNLSKRTINNHRAKSNLSYTVFFGKIFYFKQEIAGILLSNKKMKTKKFPMVLLIIHQCFSDLLCDCFNLIA